MTCNYDLDNDDLYSIKWYKNSLEFYRYVPKEQPMAKTFNVSGVNVDVSYNTKNNFKSLSIRILISQISKSNTIVTLKPFDKSSEGSYRCEVIGEPSYTTVFLETHFNYEVPTIITE